MTMKFAQNTGMMDKYKAFVDHAMRAYDLSGWTTDRWVNSEKSGPSQP